MSPTIAKGEMIHTTTEGGAPLVTPIPLRQSQGPLAET